MAGTPKKAKMDMSSPRSVPRYWKLSTRDFINPYGAGLKPENLSKDTFSRRLTPVSSYWLSEPGKALSTTANTLKDSSKQLREMLADNSITATLEEYCTYMEELANTMAPLDTAAPGFSNKDRKNAAKLFREKISDLENLPKMKKFALIGGNLFVPSFLLVQAGVLFSDMKIIKEKASPKDDKFKNWLAQEDQSVKSFFKKVVVPEVNGSPSAAPESAAGTSMKDRLSQL